MTIKERFLKRIFDIVLSLISLVLTLPIIFLAWLIASFDTRSNGFFVQKRVGRLGMQIKVVKIKTMKNTESARSSITANSSSEITKSGSFFRKTKIDELPQLFNVLIGDMSFVGPRPDVPGYADLLKGDDRQILQIRPGITGPASIKYKDEEKILANEDDPKKYNDEIIWPDKVLINKEYMNDYSLIRDVKYIIKTVLG